jgi:predicted metallo-beta-lactamase superfamily hydrolase
MKNSTKLILSLAVIASAGIHAEELGDITFHEDVQMENSQVCQAATYYYDQSLEFDRGYFANTISGKENIYSKKEALTLFDTITDSINDNRKAHLKWNQDIKYLVSIGQQPNITLHNKIWPADKESYDFLPTKDALIKYAKDLCQLDPEA